MICHITEGVLMEKAFLSVFKGNSKVLVFASDL